MGKILSLVLLLLFSACVTQTEKNVVAPPPAVAQVAIKPLPRPERKVYPKDYTAPYPKLSAPAYVAPKAVIPVSIPEKTVLEKAMELPPEEIEEGKYRTFRRVEDDIAHDTMKLRGTIAEIIFPEMNDVVEKPKGKPQPEAFCYKTLADSTCYSQPIKGQEFRRVGKY